MSFDDFNNDGFSDIQFFFLTNTPGISDLFVFNKSDSNFLKVQQFFDYPDVHKVDNSKYLYSYHRSGCNDFNWDTDLFYIQNDQIIQVANMHADDCDLYPKEKGIFVFKYLNGKKNPFEKLPISRLKTCDKFEFIARYWKKFYKHL